MCFCTNSQVFLCENRKMHTGFHLNYVMNFYFYFAKLCFHLLFRPICGTVTIQIYSGYFVPARSVTSVSKHTAGPPACPADLKYSNRIQVIETFLSGGVYSANDISASIGLSRQTVMKSIQFFLRSGLLVSAGKGDSTNLGGKRPELFTLSQEKYFLCITLWPQELRLHLFTIGKQLTDLISLTTPLPGDPRAAIDNVGQLAGRLLEKHRIPPDNLCAVSLSTAGTVDYKTGRLKYSSQSPGWGTDIPLVSYLQPYFSPHTMIFLENAGKMTARPFLLEKDLVHKRVLVIFACWGLSSCLIEKGHILSGKNSLIGEIGHMIIDPKDPEKCGCGSHGCLERLVSVERVRTVLHRQAAQFPQSRLLQIPLEQVGIGDVFTASGGGDPLARSLVEYLARAFAAALRNICLVFDPDLIVFQGDYAYADGHFDRQLRSSLQEFQYFPSEGPFEIRYDRRPLAEMDALGSYTALIRRYFATPALYQEPEA